MSLFPDYARGVVLPDFTDEALQALTTDPLPGVRRCAELLLSVPAAQRQNVEAEVTRRTSRTNYHKTNSGLCMAVSVSTGSPDDARTVVVAELLATRRGDPAVTAETAPEPGTPSRPSPPT